MKSIRSLLTAAIPRSRGRRSSAIAVAVVATAFVAVGGTALAGSAGEVKTFTGCLSSGDGVIMKVKEGMQPKSSCSSGQTLARISGGDITKIAVTGGLTLTNGGDSGDVEINLDPKYSLPQACSSGQVAKWNGIGWRCAADNDTTYSNGTGLDLTGASFSIAPAYRVKNDPDCSTDTFATGFDGNGDVQCAVPSGSPQSYYSRQTPSTITVKDDYTDYEIVRLDLPAGKYVLSSSGTIKADTDEGVSAGDCQLLGGVGLDASDFHDEDSDVAGGDTLSTISLNVVAKLTVAASVLLQCKAFSTFDQAEATDFEIVAIRVS